MSGQTRQVLGGLHEGIQEVPVAILENFHQTLAPALIAICPSAQVESFQEKIVESAALP
jgi:hypothetical protein